MRADKNQKFSFKLIVVFLLLTLGIGTAGYFYYENQKSLIIRDKQNELSAIADLKVNQIVLWRQERIKDVIIIAKNPVIINSVSRFMRNENIYEYKAETLELLSELITYYDYERAMLFDTNGRLALWSGEKPEDAEIHARMYVADAMKRGGVDFIDLHKDEPSGSIHFGLSVPLFSQGTKGSRLIGVLILRIDPFKFLYPLIQAWPTASPTGETLLIRREGNEVIYLNELRHQRNTAFSLHFPLSKKEIPAVMAVLGKKGVVEGLDYRGIPVFAAVGAIPGSPWSIVAKVDKEEIYDPLARRALLVLIAVIALIIAAGASVGLWWRQERAVYYRRQYEAEVQFNEERKKAEKLLLENETRLKRAQEISHLGSWELDLVNNKITWSDEVYRIFGLRPQEFGATYEAFLEAVHPEDRKAVDEAYSGSLREGRDTYEIEHRVVRKAAGEIRYVHEKCEHVRDKTGRIILSAGMVHDITERKKAEDALSHYTSELKRSNEELQQFAYIASHDLQEPLRMIASYLQLIERRYKGRLDKDADEFIAFAADGAGRLQEMIIGLLAYSRVQTKGKAFEEVDASEVLGNAVSNLKIAIKESGALVTADTLPVVKADALQLLQVFQNLISNSIKFRGGELPVIHISAERKKEEWFFSVKDNGIGIAPQYKDKIFNIFQRLHGREYPGVGIGLSLCRRIIERHGGRIWFESEAGKGSTFYFTIPIKEDKDEQKQ